LVLRIFRPRTRSNIAYQPCKLEIVTLAEQLQALVTSLTEEERQPMLAYGNARYAADPFYQVMASAKPRMTRPLPLLIGAPVAEPIMSIVAALLPARREVR
jgi:hypothetical protein